MKKSFNNNLKSAAKTILIFSLYKCALDALFILGTSKFYLYLGRTLEINSSKYIVGWIFFLILSILINIIKSDYIRFMIKCLFLLCGISNLSIYGLRNQQTDYFLIVLIFWFLLILGSLLTNILVDTKKESSSLLTHKPKKYLGNNLIILGIGISIAIYAVAKFGINVKSFSDLYIARESYRSIRVSTLDNYLLAWNGTVILPWSFMMFFRNRQYGLAIVALLCAILMFQINGMKTWLIMYVIVLGFVFLLRKKSSLDSVLNWIAIGISAITLCSLVVYLKTGSYNLAGLIDRTIILPGEVNYYYLDFFSSHRYLYLSESIFKHFILTPYNPQSPVLIAQRYMSAAFYHNATNGMIGDFYGNFGISGIVIYPFMLIFSFVLLSNNLKKFGKVISGTVMFILMWLLVNTSFFTWIMTGGYLLYMLILYFYKKYNIVLHNKIDSGSEINEIK